MPHRDQINSESAINRVSEHQRELECVNSCNCTVGRSRQTKQKQFPMLIEDLIEKNRQFHFFTLFF